MLHLTPPETTAREAFQLCISAKVSPASLALLSPMENPVVRAAELYDAACKSASLHELDRVAFNPPGASKDDPATKAMIAMYEKRLRGTEHPGRPLFESILNRRTKCPLCGIAKVGQVDHHLPKSHYTYLSVVPDNLVPVCERCNFAKGDRFPSSPEEQTLHPYYDDIEGMRWLRAEFVVQNPGPVGAPASATSWEVRFFAVPPLGADPLLGARIAHQFSLLKLDELFEIQTADELITASLQLEGVFNAGGSEDVRANLRDSAIMRSRPRLNNWMTAMYEALAESQWYCAGGFMLVASG
ncbi:HNH endonuclease [Kitasatospora sp. NPDC091257]|uniref:HNH endonuclease n=1 Tax=Kitasatospora sp. NPDC091257 TaxID=3364084 RepID=UPI00380889FB